LTQPATYRLSDGPEELIASGWNEFVKAHPDGNIFQYPQTFELFSQVPGYTPYVTGVINASSGELCGILMSVLQEEPVFYRRLTARSIVWGGPLADNQEIALLLLKHYVNRIRKRAIYTQFRNLFSCEDLSTAFTRAGFTYLEHLNYQVKTRVELPAHLLEKMSKSRARQIRKGLTNCELTEATDENEVVGFYDLLRRLYKEKVGKPLPPLEFFTGFQKTMVPAGLGKFLLVRKEERIIGGIMTPMTPGKAIYEWYIAGMDKEYKDEYPSILATWYAILEGHRMDMEHFDFLGAGKPSMDYGVREFKSKFGGELVNFGRFEMIHRPLLMKLGTLGLKIYRYIRK